jgi:hypothetical protein
MGPIPKSNSSSFDDFSLNRSHYNQPSGYADNSCSGVNLIRNDTINEESYEESDIVENMQSESSARRSHF